MTNYTNYTLRIPVEDVVGQDVDFWMKKPASIEELRKALRKALKENLDIQEVETAELDQFLLNWGVWDELKVDVDIEGEIKQARFGSYIEQHIEFFETKARQLAGEEVEEVQNIKILIPETEPRIGSLKARMGIGDITAE